MLSHARGLEKKSSLVDSLIFLLTKIWNIFIEYCIEGLLLAGYHFRCVAYMSDKTDVELGPMELLGCGTDKEYTG